jgi:hypothetical protein
MNQPWERLALAGAGAAGAAAWAVQQPIDKRMFGHDYDDVKLLGMLFTRGRAWWAVGMAAHMTNGAIFGLAYSELRRRTPGVSPWLSAQAMAQAENFGLFPLTAIVDRHHPARDQWQRLWLSRRALAQATWRHAILGLALGLAAHRLESARVESRRGSRPARSA